MLTCLKAATPRTPLLTQIKQPRASSPTIQPAKTKTMRVSAMFNSSELSDELQTLKSEVVLLLNSEGDGVFDAAKGRADAIADQIKAALNELGEAMSEQEDHAEALIAEHPIATITS